MIKRDPDEMIGLRAAAEEAGCHYFTVWRAAKEGRLAATRRGSSGRYRVRRRDLERWNGDRRAGRA